MLLVNQWFFSLILLWKLGFRCRYVRIVLVLTFSCSSAFNRGALMTLLEAVLYNNLSWASFNFLGAPGLGFFSSSLFFRYLEMPEWSLFNTKAMLLDDLPSKWRASITARSSSVSSRPLGISSSLTSGIVVKECIEAESSRWLHTFTDILRNIYFTVIVIKTNYR